MRLAVHALLACAVLGECPLPTSVPALSDSNSSSVPGLQVGVCFPPPFQPLSPVHPLPPNPPPPLHRLWHCFGDGLVLSLHPHPCLLPFPLTAPGPLLGLALVGEDTLIEPRR